MEDIDLQDALAVIESISTISSHPTPEADVRLHPSDYFIVGN